MLGAAIAGNILLTNRATVLLSYPIQVVFKSSKLLLAMAVRRFVFGKRNSTVDCVAAVLLCAGLGCFLAPAATSHSPSHDHSHDTHAHTVLGADGAAGVAGGVGGNGSFAGVEVGGGVAGVLHAAPTLWEFMLGIASIVGALFAESAMLNLQEHYFFEKYKTPRVSLHTWGLWWVVRGAWSWLAGSWLTGGLVQPSH